MNLLLFRWYVLCCSLLNLVNCFVILIKILLFVVWFQVLLMYLKLLLLRNSNVDVFWVLELFINVLMLLWNVVWLVSLVNGLCSVVCRSCVFLVCKWSCYFFILFSRLLKLRVKWWNLVICFFEICWEKLWLECILCMILVIFFSVFIRLLCKWWVRVIVMFDVSRI